METITVNIPAGVTTGNYIPLKSQGDVGLQNGPAGDIVVFIEEIEHKLFERQNDDYSSLLIKTLAIRLAEALAEKIHQRIRVEYWGYADKEKPNKQKPASEKFIGIRPSPGYPACPDHSQKKTLFSLLDVENNIGIELTRSLAMVPLASVCGWYFSHPQSRYFSVSKITGDQVEDYAARCGISKKEASRRLKPIILE